MPSTYNFADLPEEALHLIYSNLPLRQTILLSLTCQKARHAVASLPNNFKKDVTILMRIRSDHHNAYSSCAVPARKVSSAKRYNFENSFLRQDQEPLYNRQEIDHFSTSPKLAGTSRVLTYELDPLLEVTSCEQFQIITFLLDLVRMDWFTVIRYIALNKRQPFLLILDLDTGSQNYCGNILTLERSLHSSVFVVSRVSLVVILWNIANSGIRSVDIRYSFSYRLFAYIPLHWFSHLALWLIPLPRDFTKNSLRDFEQFVMKYLEGGFKGSSFNYCFWIPYGEEMKKRYNPFSAQLENIRKELGQSESICYYKSEETGVDVVWRTMNKGQYRVSWQGPVFAPEPKKNTLQMRVKGMIDSDDAVPRTRKLTPALQRQMDSAFSRTVGM